VLRGNRKGEVLRPDGAGELLPAQGHRFETVRMSVNAAPLPAPPRQLRSAEQMWAEMHERLRAFVARRVPDRAVVDDLAQEILLRLYAHIGRLREQERLDAWAYQVARNVIADYWRDHAGRRELPFDPQLHDRPDSLPEAENDDDADLLRREIASCLAPMVERLAEPYREAIRLTHLGDRTQVQAAATLGLSVPGMKARVQRGRAQLREVLRSCCRIELDRRGQITELEPRGRRSCACHRARH
jgi:RNA polymerase sigma-70 factor, ECF subfamily